VTAAVFTLTDEPDRQRYVARLDTRVAGLIAYVLDASVITLVHTEVRPAYEGQGVAGRLARFVLDDARTRGLRVVPTCPFVADWIRRHPDYADLVAAGR
jgi:predicted GNAT family acetyltransferase